MTDWSVGSKVIGLQWLPLLCCEGGLVVSFLMSLVLNE